MNRTLGTCETITKDLIFVSLRSWKEGGGKMWGKLPIKPWDSDCYQTVSHQNLMLEVEQCLQSSVGKWCWTSNFIAKYKDGINLFSDMQRLGKSNSYKLFWESYLRMCSIKTMKKNKQTKQKPWEPANSGKQWRKVLKWQPIHQA